MDRTASSVAPKLRLPTKMFFMCLPFLDWQNGESRQDRTGAVGTGHGWKMPKSADCQNYSSILSRQSGVEQVPSLRGALHFAQRLDQCKPGYFPRGSSFLPCPGAWF